MALIVFLMMSSELIVKSLFKDSFQVNPWLAFPSLFPAEVESCLFSQGILSRDTC